MSLSAQLNAIPMDYDDRPVRQAAVAILEAAEAWAKAVKEIEEAYRNGSSARYDKAGSDHRIAKANLLAALAAHGPSQAQPETEK